ncbi:MAG TPA: DUF554 domain-containing protein [Saprospiraceae bacterium]|nr:DUF554 domain-containing protein [Saprospiraceae bacterium]
MKQITLPLGTFINMATVLVGSLIGLWLQNIFPARIESIIFQAIGLGTLLIGLQMALKAPDGYLLELIFSLIIGGIIGELIHFDQQLNQLGDALKGLFQIGDGRFTEGLITAFLLFCIGSMTIVGAIEEGLQGKRELLMIKATLDGVSSIAFAATYGIGVLFSIVPMLILQGGITVLTSLLKHSKKEAIKEEQPLIDPVILNQLSAAGGLLILGIGIRLLHLGTINIENLLPGLLVAVVVTGLSRRMKGKEF